ncbi:putative PX protein [Hordeum vulgare]|nr:putative PX protein [Hordeum vulgare]
MGLLSRSEEVAVLVRLKVAAGPIRREIPPEMHWAFAYEMLQRVSCSLALGPELRNAVCVFYLVQELLSICVMDPVKMGTGVQSYISYRVITKVIRLVLCSKSWISRFYDVETLAGVAWSLVPLAAANATLQANGTTRMLAAASAALQADSTMRAVAQCPPWNITVAECALCLYNSVQDFVTPVKYKAKCEDIYEAYQQRVAYLL